MFKDDGKEVIKYYLNIVQSNYINYYLNAQKSVGGVDLSLLKSTYGFNSLSLILGYLPYFGTYEVFFQNTDFFYNVCCQDNLQAQFTKQCKSQSLPGTF